MIALFDKRPLDQVGVLDHERKEGVFAELLLRKSKAFVTIFLGSQHVARFQPCLFE